MKLIFEKSSEGRALDLIPASDVPACLPDESIMRKQALNLPELSENQISRHYSELAEQSYGVNDGLYPLGSCTMKYNPKINEETASLPGFTKQHPLQPQETSQGSMKMMYMAEESLCRITGMDAMTFQPAAGAHGEFTGLLLIKAYHESRGDKARTNIIIPDSAHGTNPASSSMAGYNVISIPSDEHGCVDLNALKDAADDNTAGLMLTNPNTLGIFDPNILEITNIVHDAGGLCYYDGANLNAIMGIVRPGDMGFDAVHLNLHKTFSTPHGGGGPGSGPVGCKAFLEDFLPGLRIKNTDSGFRFEKPASSIGEMKMFYGNFLVIVRALTYILTLGREGIPEAASNAVLNANYMKTKLSDVYETTYDGPCMHEFVLTMEKLKHDNGTTAMDIAKALLDHHIHPPTMYFPLIVDEALMIEPTETEPKETLDEAIDAFIEIMNQAVTDPDALHESPVNTPIGRPDEVTAARKPVLRYD